jgi:hypothetical protein
MRRLGNEPFAPGTTPMRARHVCLGPGLVDENQSGWIKLALMTLPSIAPSCDVGTILFAGVQAFF